MQLDRALAGYGYGEEIMAIEPSAMRGFSPRPRARRGERVRSEVAGMAIEWEDGLARMGSIALVQIEGPLSRCAGWFSMGYDEILEAHDEANRSDARGVIQVVHSPGGYLSGLDSTYQEIEKMFRASGKPLWNIAADMSYSAAEWLSFCASKRFVTRAGGRGSIGVLVTRADWTKANEMMGITYHQIASGEYKTDGDPDTAASKAELERIRERVMFHAGLFFDAGARATGLSVDEIRAQEAGIYLGENAVKARLADGVETLAGVIAQLEKQTQGRPMVAVPNGPKGQQQTARKHHMEMGMLAIALGLTAESKDQEITARVQTLTGIENKLRDATGKADVGAAFAVIDGWRDASAKLTEAQGELARVRDREEKANYEGLVRQGELSAQITPGNRAKVLERFPTSAQLAAYLETAPAALPSAANAGEKPAGKPPETPPAANAKPWLTKAYKDLSYSERAAWANEDRPAWAAAKGEYERSKGGE